MLNHATSRVNESEHERAVSEVEHRRTTGLYHKCEHEVQLLQKELKRAITKSRYIDVGFTPNETVLIHCFNIFSSHHFARTCNQIVFLLFLNELNCSI